MGVSGTVDATVPQLFLTRHQEQRKLLSFLLFLEIVSRLQEHSDEELLNE